MHSHYSVFLSVSFFCFFPEHDVTKHLVQLYYGGGGGVGGGVSSPPLTIRKEKIQIGQFRYFKVPPRSKFYLLIFRCITQNSIKNENVIYRLQIPALIPEIFTFEKCAKYANEMTDDVIHSTQYYIMCINRAILANLQRRSLKLGRLIVLQNIHLRL